MLSPFLIHLVKMKKSFFTTVLIALSFSSILAEDRTEQEMMQIAEQQLGAMATLARSEGPAHPFAIQKLKNGKTYSIYGAKDMGFVVVSSDNLIQPVLGYSMSTFQEDKMPCGFNWWLNAVSESIERRIETNNYVASISRTPVENFVTTQWGQEYPYNMLCPKVDEQLPPSGCVATAIAQILCYYKYPQQGKGKGYYAFSNDGPHITGDINGIYQWDNIWDTYPKEGVADDKVTAIATVLKDCGLAAGMTYELAGSGASSLYTMNGMVDNFSYDANAVKFYSRDFFTDEEWMEIIYDELSHHRPILYSGSDVTYGGHAFLFSGFDEEGKVYVNWGWNGNADGYFDISDLSPEGILNVKQSIKFHFGNSQSMGFGFKPQGEAGAQDKYESLFGTEEGFNIAVSSTNNKILEVALGTYYNYHYKSFEGKLGFYFENENGNTADCSFVNIDANLSLKSLQGRKHDIESFSKPSLRNVKAGSYKVYLASWDNQETVPQPVRTVGKGATYFVFTKASDGTLTVSEEKPFITGIDNVYQDVANSSLHKPSDIMYNLQGQRVTNGYRGIVIRNGRKYVK